MSAKTANLPGNQAPLFEGFHFIPGEYAAPTPFVPWTEYGDAQKVAAVTAPEKGAYVDIDSRNALLLNTLKHLGHASMLGGLEAAMDTPRRAELIERYGDDLPDMLASSEVKKRDTETAARSDFREAYGYKQTVEYMEKPVQVSHDFVDEYDKFQKIHYGSKGNKAREKLMARIEKNQKASLNGRFVQRAIGKSLQRSNS